GLDMVHVPYKGGAGPAVAGLMGGETHVMFTTAASAIGQVRGGKLKLLAVTSPRRMEQAPSAPTMVESGYPDFVTGSWQGVFVPAGTPREVVDKLFKAIQQTMSAPEVGERLKVGGAEVVISQSRAGFMEFVAAEPSRDDARHGNPPARHAGPAAGACGARVRQRAPARQPAQRRGHAGDPRFIQKRSECAVERDARNAIRWPAGGLRQQGVGGSARQ